MVQQNVQTVCVPKHHIPYQDMTQEQQEAKRRAEVMLAFANGAPIEYRPKDRPDLVWGITTIPVWDWVVFDYRVNHDPVVNWDAMPAWANAVAMDESGVWSWYEKKPEQMGSRYHITQAGCISGQIPDEHAPKYAGTKPWNELIIERPKK